MQLTPLALGLILITGAAAAQSQQSPCGPYEIIAGSLNSEYHESPVARMLADQGFAIEILAAVDGSTFTVLAVQPNGTACLLSTGTAFALVNPATAPAPGSNS